MNAKRKNEAIEWAQDVLAHADEYVIFDTETTGLKESDVIVHFAVMDLDGKMLIDTKVKPMSKRRMSQDAQYIHGMTMKDLQDAPRFEEVVEVFRPIAVGKKILVFNSFHAEMFEQTYYNEGVSGEPIALNCWDVKSYFEKFLDRYDRLALPGRKNTGEGDCRAVLAVIKKMAEAELADTQEEERTARAERTKQNNKEFFKVAGWVLIVVGIIAMLSGGGVWGVGLIAGGLILLIIAG